ncbi:hypothetical protein O6H91_13G071600 [Diphasiastrum complanatum]|uniref:Uncharacterized protein n=3 Tax=Diphasiastrum complanatum TaxID=34168 RepID=A0ACC2BX07_DIPCM|nr:hypothetical protein O6H91_13G071600 [Diphasiastrum complanatum]KAJ7533927.1 hypothetical protein O6H91_13G071600 [Diphasiastrum complanatum]KAJ7533928.1 hypothetical protein O6H91_13G071600 [Diphasiastrum complanatum]
MVLERSSLCGADSKISVQEAPHGWASTQHISIHSRARAEDWLRHNVLNPATNSHPHCGLTQSDDNVYDPGAEYAQVLAEAKRHAMIMGSTGLSPSVTATSFTYARSNGLKVDCIGCHPTQSGQEKKSRDGYKKGHSWKAFIFFWRRFRKTEGAYRTSHQVVYKPRTKSVPLSSTQISRRAVSGPLYTDGLPVHPSHRPLSGNLSDSSRIDKILLSPYVPLKQHHRHRNYSGPLYMVS